MENKLKKIIEKCETIISKKGYLELGYKNEVRIEAEKLSDNDDEIHKLVLNCEDYLEEYYNCIDDDLSGYIFSKELSFENIEEFYKYFKISEKKLEKRYII